MNIRAESPNGNPETGKAWYERHPELAWNEVDKTNGHPYADLVAAGREIANDPKCDLVHSERRIRLYAALAKLSALDYPRRSKASPQIPNSNAATTALTLTQEEIEERNEATCDYLDELEAKYRLREAGSNDGEGESYSARQV